MHKRLFHFITAAVILFLLAYFITSIFDLEHWGNYLSPLNAFTAAAILLYTYLKSNRHHKVSLTFLLNSIACFVWGVADIIWAVLDFSGEDPSVNALLWIIYLLTNCFILSSILIYAVKQFSKWNLFQVFIDTTVIGLMTLVFIWIVFLNKDISKVHALIQMDFTSIVSIITDVLIFIAVISWFLSIRAGKIQSFSRIISLGLVLFAIVDMLYYYIDFNGLYAPDSLIDFSYVLSLNMIAFGALWMAYKYKNTFDLGAVANIGRRRRARYLLIFPLIIALLELLGLDQINLNIVDIATYLILIALYRTYSKYVQLSVENAKLLKTEMETNAILEKRVAEQVSELTFLANQDTLTTLFNRRYFLQSLDESIRSKRPNETLALMLIDLDRFKTINDHFGHNAGDQVLIEISYRLIEWNNYGATVARLGGDEFAIMLIGKYTQKEIEDICIQIFDFCSKPISINNDSMAVSLSIGVALFSNDAHDNNTLMKNADIAMYRAKSQGYNKYQFYNPIVSQDINNKNKIEVLLRQANVADEFELFYQPQFSLPDMELIGAEALVRWKSTEYGYIPPNVFIPVAEEIDYIMMIGKWVMQEAIKQAIRWNSSNPRQIKIGFNLSPKQLKDDQFIHTIKPLICDTDVNVSWLDAEITESIMIGDEAHVHSAFQWFKDTGITISIDDFGSGYSSLGYLSKYPFDRIKIDRSLVDNLSYYNENGANVVKAAITMAKSIGIKTIAEGVETQEQLDILTSLGCDQVQGYLLGRPVPADVFEQRFLSANRKPDNTM